MMLLSAQVMPSHLAVLVVHTGAVLPAFHCHTQHGSDPSRNVVFPLTTNVLNVHVTPSFVLASLLSSAV